ncbi:DUF4365 domain-containing protein [Nocardia sp. CA-129566]|uniref:DUF4365 domain-containing protein n=1 Tax=Nocardia sp. CA-129566 TaxID=3239976 RepID=UPI003D994A17
MPTRRREQRTGDAGETLVRGIVDSHRSWVCRTQDRDFGVDLEAEFAPGDDDRQKLTGKLLKLQVKASQSWRTSYGRLAVQLDRDYLDYVAQFRLPVILVAVDLAAETACWVWLQAWLLDNELRLAATQSDQVTVHVPRDQTLDTGLHGQWCRIATGSDPVSTVLALRETVTAARASRNNQLLEGTLALLDLVDPAARTWTVEKAIDALTALGSNAARWQASALEPHLMAIVDRFGYALTADQVLRLVMRDDLYSRAGLAGLGRLYDQWPEHAHSLGLRDRFIEAGAEVIAWYCEMRHRHHDRRSFELVTDAAAGRLGSMQFLDLVLNTDDLLHTFLNRGDSALLDHLVLVEPPGESGGQVETSSSA